MKTKYALIIDVAVTGNSLAYEFVNRGCRIINIYSSKKVFQKLYKSLNTSIYETCLIYESDEQLLVDLDQYKNDIICCCPGSDYGLPLSNHLNELFGLGINNKLISDRFEVLKASGEPVTDNNFNDFLNQYKKCVIKPKVSYGGYDRISVVESLKNIDTTDMLIMPWYNGDEYVVDMVTLNGKHKLVSVWKYAKENGFWREKITLLDCVGNEDLIKKLYNYTCNILNNVNYNLGATHTEIILENNVPKLIEINFRTHGHLDYDTSFKILTQPQIQLTVDAMLGDEITFTDLRPIYCKKTNMERINLFNNRERRHSQFPWQQISKLSSFAILFRHYLLFENIPVSKKTVESIPGEVILINTNPEQLHKDEQEIYRLCNE
jgi:hypothetical protein